MSGNIDWTLIVVASQKAQAAAEAAAGSARLLESEAGHRLSAIEARLTGAEGRLTTLAAGQHGHALALQRVSDMLIDHTATQADHTARLTRIEAKLVAIEATLASIAARLPP